MERFITGLKLRPFYAALLSKSAILAMQRYALRLLGAALFVAVFVSIQTQVTLAFTSKIARTTKAKSKPAGRVNIGAVNAARTISGVVFDGEKRAPLKFALVELYRKSDHRSAGRKYTDTSGKFDILTTENAELSVKINVLGYEVYNADIAAGTDNVTLNPVYLGISLNQLKEVKIAARTPVVSQQVDRLSYNVQADPESKINSLLDMLRKVPLISVDADDNVKLKSSSSFKVLIDGKESSIVANNPKDVFRSMAASNILRIEVITTPPAKYDSEGLAGIINIITVKKVSNGYNGSAGISYKDPNGPRANASINLKSGKFGLSAFGGLTRYNTPRTSFTNSQRSLTSTISDIFQQGSAKTNSSLGYISTQLSYEIDTLNLITANLGYNQGNNDKSSTIFTQQTIGTLFQSYRIDNNGDNKSHGYDLGLDYQLGFSRSKAQFLTLSYKFGSNKNKQFNNVMAFDRNNYNSPDYTQANNSGTTEHTIQLDYIHPLKKLQIEGGVKGILRKNFSDYEVADFDPATSIYLPDNANSNQFNYQQNVYAIYNSYQLNLNKWTLKAGIRGERTVIDANFLSTRLHLILIIII
jgi:hypothetical protein